MDQAFQQHSRRKNRSSTNINRLSLAPLTPKLPLDDVDTTTAPIHSTSYLEGKSAPTTPRLLSHSAARSPSRARFASTPGSVLPKSKSATHLVLSNNKSMGRGARSGTASPLRRRKDDPTVTEEAASEWLFRTGALVTSETRESKGQAWLVSRASSTSLSGGKDRGLDEDMVERQMEREREVTSRQHSRHASRHTSRRGSMVNLSDARAPHSRAHSGPHSRSGDHAQAFSPLEDDVDGYFVRSPVEEDYTDGPDFVNLDERLEALGGDALQDDEAAVRRLVRRGQAGRDSWLASVLGWSLFSVEEGDDESDGTGEEADETDTEGLPEASRSSSSKHLDRLNHVPQETLPPPQADEGGWKDAAWLLSVATKVIL